MSIRMSAGAAAILAAAWAGAQPEDTASVPMARADNPQFSVNSFEPERVNRLFLTLRLRNPATGDSRIHTESWIDTAADHCYLSKRAAEALRLKLSAQPPVWVHTPAGALEMRATEVEYDLLDRGGVPIGRFPRIKTHFYVNPRADAPYDVVLGQLGFLDRIDTLTLDFRRRLIVLTW